MYQKNIHIPTCLDCGQEHSSRDPYCSACTVRRVTHPVEPLPQLDPPPPTRDLLPSGRQRRLGPEGDPYSSRYIPDVRYHITNENGEFMAFDRHGEGDEFMAPFDSPFVLKFDSPQEAANFALPGYCIRVSVDGKLIK